MSCEERQARSLALEKAYVHDVYDQIAPHFTDTRYRAWPRVKQFLLDLEPASLVADVGCGNGKYLDSNREVVMIGSDRCSALSDAARAKNHEVVTCDNLQLPFRDETFDAALSVAVIHHFATTDRRVAALKELARVLRIGGKVLITVWAMEQRHRKFDSQDVLVPWHEPVKSSSEDRASSVERELTSTTTSDDDVLVYHAYSHISDSEAAQRSQSTSNINRRRQKFRNARGRYRSAGGSFDHCNTNAHSRSSSELSSPNETCYSFVKRALQKLSGTTSSASNAAPSNPRPYFYRSCRKPWASASMEFGPNLDAPDPDSSRNELYHQSSIESECPDQANDDDVPIELRHLEGYESCMNCGSPVQDVDGHGGCEMHVCTSCLPLDTADSTGKKSRSLGDFFNMIPKLLRSKKCDKEPLSDLHKRISTASDPREYVIKSRGGNVNGIVRSKSTVSFMSRLEELMSFSASSEKNNIDESTNSGQSSKSRNKPPRLPSLTATSLVDGDCPVIIPETDRSTNPRRYNSPADALRKLRQDVSLEEPDNKKLSNLQHNVESKPAQITTVKLPPENMKKQKLADCSNTDVSKSEGAENTDAVQSKDEPENAQEGYLSSYYSMPELYKLIDEQAAGPPLYPAHRQRHISFYEQAKTVMANTESTDESNQNLVQRIESACTAREHSIGTTPQRVLVKRSLSVDTGDSSVSSNQCPRRFSASAAQGGGVLASALRTYSLPRSSSRGSSVKSDTSVDSEESIVSVIPRKGNSITSDTSVDSEESVISVIQRSTSEIETLVRESGLRNNISRLGSRSARASPVTVLSSQTSSAESSPPQSGKNDGKFPGSGGVIEQLVQQQQQQQQHQLSLYSMESTNLRQDSCDYVQRTRRSLLRPLSDTKTDERLYSSFDETSAYRSTSRQTSGSNRSSLESDDQIIKEEDEKLCETVITSGKAVTPTTSKEDVRKEEETTELSRTPSPIGPFKYIYDPLLTDPNPSISGDSTSFCKNYEKLSDRDTFVADDPSSIASDKVHDEFDKTKEQEISHNVDDNIERSSVSESEIQAAEASKTSEAERHEKLRKLSQRLENLGLSSELLKSFYMSSEDNEETFSDPSTEPLSSDLPREDHEECFMMEEDSQSDACCIETVLEKSDEDSAIDESLKTVIHDVQNLDISEGLPHENMLKCEVAEIRTAEPEHRVESDAVPNESNASCSETDRSFEQKKTVSSAPRRKLKRSCVTIDEVECREVMSSEDTSPSSSTSLEWNDFDKVDAAGTSSHPSYSVSSGTYRGASNFQQREEGTASSPEDVNVAETENKFNVFLDKEICVFFETPSSSSIGKSASSSSNATDFSTTSDRIRGVMQRDKSDDRSSKESDSDNLSKLSDLEPKSDSAFSEDYSRRTTDVDSSYIADLADAHRSKTDSLQSWCDYDGAIASTSREKHAWRLDNIDEIPDDDKDNDISRTLPKLRRNWSDEDGSSHRERRRDNFYGNVVECRDMYKMSSEDSSPNQDDTCKEKNSRKERCPAVVNHPVAVQEASGKSSDESEVPTDILSAFVETITDLTSVFGELYPRHEGKFEDISSDDSLEISSFERILTSQEPQPVTHRRDEEKPDEQPRDRQFTSNITAPEPDASCSKTQNSYPYETPDGHSKDNSRKFGDNSRKLPLNNNNNNISNVPRLEDRTPRHPKKSTENTPNIQKQDSEESSSLTDSSKGKAEDSKPVEDKDTTTTKSSAKPKLLNRASQSVCTDKFRHDSIDEEELSVSHSAPCSPRLKLRQRSVEEVLSSSKAELSRNSSLSQSTSQESLPGNETGGLMAYHRYYHVFRQGELDSLIENYVENLHIIASYYDHANWCVVAEKVQVWTI